MNSSLSSFIIFVGDHRVPRNLFIIAYAYLVGDRMEDITVRTDNLQKILLDEVVIEDEEDELAFYINRFNLDPETVESMPALSEHVKTLLSETVESGTSSMEDELAFFISRFNLDAETLAAMPAFEEHVRSLLPDIKEQNMTLHNMPTQGME